MADTKKPPSRRVGRCPICNAPAHREARPFCSRRCADVDLGRWFTGSYRMPTDERPGSEAPADDDDNTYPIRGG